MPRRDCDNCNGTGVFSSECGCGVWCVYCERESLRRSGMDHSSCWVQRGFYDSHGWAVRESGLRPNSGAVVRIIPESFMLDSPPNSQTVSFDEIPPITALSAPFVSGGTITGSTRPAKKVKKVCQKCYGTLIQQLACGCQGVCGCFGGYESSNCFQIAYDSSAPHGWNTRYNGTKPIAGDCPNCHNPYGLKRYNCGCVGWCLSCQPQKYRAFTPHFAPHAPTLLIEEDDLPLFNPSVYPPCAHCRNYYSINIFPCGCAQWCSECSSNYRHQPIKHSRENCWAAQEERNENEVFWLRDNGIHLIDVPFSIKVVNWEEEDMATHNCRDGVRITPCGCMEWCNLHSNANYLLQTTKLPTRGKRCWIAVRDERRSHGWNTGSCGQYPFLETSESDPEVCNNCDGTGVFTSSYCGNCLEFCINCHNREYIAQPIKLVGCWTRQFSGSRCGWRAENGVRPAKEPDYCPNCQNGVFRFDCGCEWWCSVCRKEKYIETFKLAQQTEPTFNGCWSKFMLADNGEITHGWYEKLLGPRPTPIIITILIEKEENEKEGERQMILSRTIPATVGFAHSFSTNRWGELKKKKLNSLAKDYDLGSQLSENGMTLFSTKMRSRENASNVHKSLLGYLKHPLDRFMIQKPVIPGDLKGVPFALSDRFLDRMGLELEGGWNIDPGTRLFGDGSVRTRGSFGSGEVHTIHYAQKIRWEPMIDRIWPTQIDGSCGMHTHVSFKSKGIYSIFISKEFLIWMKDEMLRWGHDEGGIKNDEFFKRFRGENRFCLFDYSPEEQLHQARNHRYTMLNYCWSVHKTIEARVLPMFKTMKEAKPAIEHLLLCFEKWAEVNYRKTVSLEQTKKGEKDEKEDDSEMAIKKPKASLEPEIAASLERLRIARLAARRRREEEF